MEINILERTGRFAGNKDVAKEIRINEILPALKKEGKKNVIINFENVDSATQSFVHALISEIIRQFGIVILERIYFKNCNKTIKKIIEIVIEYMQESNY